MKRTVLTAAALLSCVASSPARSARPPRDGSSAHQVPTISCDNEASARPACHFRVAFVPYCGGVQPGPGNQGGPECVCDHCLTDTDCGARPDGRCTILPYAGRCGEPRARACLYPGDCEACPQGSACHYRFEGGVACAPPPMPPP
jgi:hypothetical protein